MESVLVTLKRPISQFVSRRSQERHTSLQQEVMELLSLGFDAALRERYELYRRGEISFGRLAEDLGVTTWELSQLLEERGWPVYNLPVAAGSAGHASVQEPPSPYAPPEEGSNRSSAFE